jgi:hypothetical protein
LVGLLDALTVHGSRDNALVGGDERLRPEPARLRGTWVSGGAGRAVSRRAHRRQIAEMHVTATFPPQPLSSPDRPKLPRAGSRRNAGANLSI